MRALLAAERRKLTTLRTTWVLVAAVAVYPVLSFVAAATAPPGSVDLGNNPLPALIRGGADIAAVAALLLGITGMAGEYRHRTIVAALLVETRRSRVVTAKVIIHASVGTLLAALSIAVNLVGGGIYLAGIGIDPRSLPAGDLALAALGVLTAGAAYGAIGASLGAVVRDQTGAVAGALVWLLAVENAVPIVLRNPGLRDWTLGGASSRLFHLADPVPGMQPAWTAAALLAGVAVALLAAGGAVTERGEIRAGLSG